MGSSGLPRCHASSGVGGTTTRRQGPAAPSPRGGGGGRPASTGQHMAAG